MRGDITVGLTIAALASSGCGTEAMSGGTTPLTQTGADGVDDGATDDPDGDDGQSDGEPDDDGPEPTTTEGDDGPDDTGEATDEGSTGEPGCAEPPAFDAPWIADYQAGIVTELAVTQGVRESYAQRRAAGDWLLDELDALGLSAFEHEYSDTGRNVYATLPATDGGTDVYVVGAHFDTVPGSPGANDNATGVAMVLSLARYLSEVECRSANLIFVLFDEEEIGLVGSWYFAQFLDDQQLPVVSVHTIDQMGWDSDGDRTIELERADEGLLELYEGVSATLPSPIAITPTDTGFTDHVSFREFGFAAVGLTEEYVSGDTTRHYHLPSDTEPTVDAAYLQSTTVLLHAVFSTLVDPD